MFKLENFYDVCFIREEMCSGRNVDFSKRIRHKSVSSFFALLGLMISDVEKLILFKGMNEYN